MHHAGIFILEYCGMAIREFLEWFKSTVQHPLILIFILFGGVLIVLGLGAELTVWTKTLAVNEPLNQILALGIGVTIIAVTIFIMYRPPSGWNREPRTREVETIETKETEQSKFVLAFILFTELLVADARHEIQFEVFRCFYVRQGFQQLCNIAELFCIIVIILFHRLNLYKYSSIVFVIVLAPCLFST